MSIEFIGNKIAKIVDELAFIKMIVGHDSMNPGHNIEDQIYNSTWHLADEIVNLIRTAFHDAIYARECELELEELKAAMKSTADESEVAK